MAITAILVLVLGFSHVHTQSVDTQCASFAAGFYQTILDQVENTDDLCLLDNFTSYCGYLSDVVPESQSCMDAPMCSRLVPSSDTECEGGSFCCMTTTQKKTDFLDVVRVAPNGACYQKCVRSGESSETPAIAPEDDTPAIAPEADDNDYADDDYSAQAPEVVEEIVPEDAPVPPSSPTVPSTAHGYYIVSVLGLVVTVVGMFM